MKLFTKVVAVAALTAAVSTPAFAWGDREQGILAGVVGTIVLQNVMRPPVVYGGQPPAPVYNPPIYGYPQPAPVYPGYTYRPMYKAVDIFDTGCQCYRTVMVQVN